MINHLFIPFIGSIPIISANLIQSLLKLYTMGTLLVILIIAFFGFLFFSPNKEQININHENKF